MRAKWFLLAAVGLLAVSCAKEQSETPSAMMKDLPSITASTTAKVATKATVGESEGLEIPVYWDTGDAISVFYHGVDNLLYALEGEGGGPSGVFNYVSGTVLGVQFPQLYGVYPYAKETSMADGVIYTDFPAEQAFTEKSFDPQSNLMVAVSRKPEFFFQNVGGFLLLQLFGEDVQVTKAEIRGNAGEILAGPAEVYAYEDDAPSIWLDPETGSQTLALVSDEPVAVHEDRENPTEFWLVVPPTLFEEGFTVTVTDAEGGVLTAEVTSAVEIERRTIFRLDPLCLKRVSSGFAAEITWDYAEDAETDHDVFYDSEGTYGRTALALGVDAATVAKYGEEIDATAPKEVTVSVVDPDSGDLLPADDVTVSNIALKDDDLVADVAGFAWDVLYQVTVLYELSNCDLTLEGTIATVDRSREPIVLETVSEYTFTLGECDDETGYGYSGDPQGTGDGWYYWDGNSLEGDIYAAFQSAGLVAADYYSDVDSFSASELGDNVTPADPASIPEGIKTYVDLTTTGMYLYTTDSFTEAVLTGDVFSSGTSSTSDPDVVKGNTLYLCFTTYLGQEVQIPFVFNYKDGEPEPTPAPIILFSEDFENNFVEERSEDWTFIDADGDGFNWNYWDDVEYNNHFNHYSGIGHISSESYNNNYGSFTPDNWAVTPAITLSSVSNYLSFWVGAQDPSWTEEFYAVYLTTDEQPSSDPDDYVVLMAGETFGTSEPFETYDNGENRVVYRYVITIPDEYKGATVHIAFRHFNCSDNFRLNLDDVYVTETAPVVGDQEDTINPDPEPEPNPDPLPENILFLEDFEGDLDDWTFWDQDGDGYNWEFEDYYAASGSYSLTSRSYYGGALDPDNWAITPAITLSSESNYLSVYDMNYLGSWLDKYDILISAGESMTKDSFVKLAGYVPATVWTLRTIQIPDEYKGQTVHIAFRHWDSYDNFRLFIDDVTVYFGSLSGPSPVAPHFNVADGKYDFRKQLGASAREQIGLAEKMK